MIDLAAAKQRATSISTALTVANALIHEAEEAGLVVRCAINKRDAPEARLKERQWLHAACSIVVVPERVFISEEEDASDA